MRSRSSEPKRKNGIVYVGGVLKEIYLNEWWKEKIQ